MHPIDERHGLGLKRLGSGDVGLNHELFDELMGIEALALLHAGHTAVFAEADAVFGGVDFQGLPGGAGETRRTISRPQRLEDGLQQGPGLVVRLAVDGGLRLAVRELGRRFH